MPDTIIALTSGLLRFNTATQDACEYDAVLTNTPILGGNETQQTRSAGCRNVAHTGCFVNQMSEVMERLNIGGKLYLLY